MFSVSSFSSTMTRNECSSSSIRHRSSCMSSASSLTYESILRRSSLFQFCIRNRSSTTSSNNQSAPDLYTILGVKRHATEEEVKQAYIEKAKIYHPDALRRREMSNEAEGAQKDPDDDVVVPGITFEMLREAYDVLSAPDRRSHYDYTLKEAYAQGKPPPSLTSRVPKDDVARSLQSQSSKMRKKFTEKEAMPMWYVGQERPSNHQVYYYKQTVAAEKAWDTNHTRQLRRHKIVPMSRGRSLLWVTTPLFVAGIWIYNYSSWGTETSKGKDPYKQFRRVRQQD